MMSLWSWPPGPTHLETFWKAPGGRPLPQNSCPAEPPGLALLTPHPSGLGSRLLAGTPWAAWRVRAQNPRVRPSSGSFAQETRPGPRGAGPHTCLFRGEKCGRSRSLGNTGGLESRKPEGAVLTCAGAASGLPSRCFCRKPQWAAEGTAQTGSLSLRRRLTSVSGPRGPAGFPCDRDLVAETPGRPLLPSKALRLPECPGPSDTRGQGAGHRRRAVCLQRLQRPPCGRRTVGRRDPWAGRHLGGSDGARAPPFPGEMLLPQGPPDSSRGSKGSGQ